MPVVRELTTRLGYKVDDRDMKKYNGQLSAVTATIGGVASAAITAGVALTGMVARSFLSNLVSTNIQFEQLFARLKTVTGSVEGANKAFASLKEFASTTPFQLTELVESFTKLQVVGIKPTEDRLKAFGDITAAFGGNILDFTGAVQSAVAGSFEPLRRFGIFITKQGKDVTIKTNKQTQKVKNNAEAIAGALEKIGKTEWAGAMGQQMLTLAGIISNIKDNVGLFLASVGEAGFNDALREFLSTIRDIVGEGDDVAKVIGRTLGDALMLVTDYIRWVIEPSNQAKFRKWAEILSLVLNPLHRTYLLVKDLIALFSGEESFIERFLGEDVAEAIRETGETAWETLIASLIAMKDVAIELGPVLFEAFEELKPTFKELAKSGKELVEEVFRPMHGYATELELPGLIRASLPLIKFMIRWGTASLKFAGKAINLFLRFSTWLIPQLRIAWILWTALLMGRLNQIITMWNFWTNLLKTQWSSTIAVLLGFWKLLDGDITGAISSWTTALMGFVENLERIGGGPGNLVDIIGAAKNAIGGGDGMPRQLALAGAAGAGTGPTSNSTMSSLTSSIGTLLVQITGSSGASPDQTASAVRSGVGSAMKDALVDANRNTSGAVT